MSKPLPPGFEPVVPIRRSATLPTKLMPESRRFSDASTVAQDFEPVLFFHPSAKIVKFAPDAPPDASQTTASADFDYPVDTIETLPWKSPTERTVAVGRLRLEMVTGLSPFLKCGTVVQPILKNSQCWCVDSKSTFVLRIRSLTYYRIELPNGTSEEESLISQFKTALAKVLRYEVTPCPFQRGFSVPLPAEAHIPKKKRAWRPKNRRESAPAASQSSDIVNLGSTAVSFETDILSRNAEISDGEVTDGSSSTATNSIFQTPSSSNNVETGEIQDVTTDTKSTDKGSITTAAPSVHDVLARFQPIPESDSEDEAEDEDDAQSFYSLLTPDKRDSPPPPLTSAPEFPLDSQLQNPSLPDHRLHGHNRDISTATITPETITPVFENSKLPPATERLSSTPEMPKDKATSENYASTMPFQPGLSSGLNVTTTSMDLPSTSLEKDEDSSLHVRRSQTSRKRDLSPLPPASTLEYPSPQSSETAITSRLFHKTFSLVLVPPLQLLLLLIHIAARIVANEAPSQRSVFETTHNTDTEDDNVDFKLSKTPGAFRRSLLLEDPSDSLSDLD